MVNSMIYYILYTAGLYFPLTNNQKD